MARTTRADLESVVRVINEELGTQMFLQWAYGQPRLHEPSGLGYSDVSPRLPMGQMLLWLLAFERGICRGKECVR